MEIKRRVSVGDREIEIDAQALIDIVRAGLSRCCDYRA
jgi:hypothetical protein